MTELPAAARAAGYATAAEPAARQAARLRRLARHRLHVLIGPTVWDRQRRGRSYFVIGVAERKRWHFEQIAGEDREQLDQFRAALMLALVGQRPVVIHDFDDELQMVRCCHAILPTTQTEALCREIGAERAAKAAFRYPAPEAVQ